LRITLYFLLNLQCSWHILLLHYFILICKHHLIFCTPPIVHDITFYNSSHLPHELYSKRSNVPTGTKRVYLPFYVLRFS
jgi:hypothetical protein